MAASGCFILTILRTSLTGTVDCLLIGSRKAPPRESKGTIGAFGVIVMSPLLDDAMGLLERIEDFTVQHLIAKAGISANIKYLDSDRNN